jgi:hypothetical protein
MVRHEHRPQPLAGDELDHKFGQTLSSRIPGGRAPRRSLAALLGTARLRLIFLTFSAGEADRDRVVKAVTVEHYRDHTGRIPVFGTFTGYILVLLAGYDGTDFGLPFDVYGDRAGPMCSVRRLPEALLGKKRPDGRLNGLLRLSHPGMPD